MHHSLQIMFILPLMTGHLFWKATILGGLYRGVPLYTEIVTPNIPVSVPKNSVVLSQPEMYGYLPLQGPL